jgi:hypothetical protein
MLFPIHAGANVAFMGERHLHAMVFHQFSGQSGGVLNMMARARQFSSFILLAGTIVSADEFDPKIALIIQNKDDLKIPLLLEQIPPPKEFRDSIESLSPEQQRFVKAWRSMQLASTLFGICIIQIKPQLEKLLNLPSDTLTKEISLNQQLMELFIKYHIPSDLISYSGPPEAAPDTKLNTVKGYISAVNDIIHKLQAGEIQQITKEHLYASLSRSPPPQSNIHLSIPPMTRRSNKPTSRAPKGLKMGNLVHQTTPGDQLLSMEKTYKEMDLLPLDDVEDYTLIPEELDQKFLLLDEDAALRPTIIKPDLIWKKKFQKALLAKPEEQILKVEDQFYERTRAYDLLDALTKSGCLAIEMASLHVIMAATHFFDKSLLDTLVQQNVNPIEKVERSNLIMATTIHNKPAKDLIKPDQEKRLITYSPQLFGLPLEQKSLEYSKKL